MVKKLITGGIYEDNEHPKVVHEILGYSSISVT